MNTMKNAYQIVGNDVQIQVATRGEILTAYIDLVDLPTLQAINCTWYANPARAPKGKFYANAKLYNRETQKTRTVLMHRLLMGEPRLDSNGTAIEVHHKDNDGLNNRRSTNLRTLTHQANLHEAWPQQPPAYWDKKDLTKMRRAIVKRLREIMNEVRVEFGVTRAHLWNVRRGYSGRKRSAVADAYWKRVMEAMPELFAGDVNAELYPWLIVKDFLDPKPVNSDDYELDTAIVNTIRWRATT